MLEITGKGTKNDTSYDVYVPILANSTRFRTFRKMQATDAVITEITTIIKSIYAQIRWIVKPADDSTKAQDEAAFFQTCMGDAYTSWNDFLQSVCINRLMGNIYYEQVYKYRKGPNTRLLANSNYDDNRIGWADLQYRPPSTYTGWAYDKDELVIGIIQNSTVLPFTKGLFFRRGVPEDGVHGSSPFEAAYKHWVFQNKLEEIEAIGIDRDLTGLPTLTVPIDFLKSDATNEQKAMLNSFKNIMAKIRYDEAGYLILPSNEFTDSKGVTHKTGFTFSLLGSTSTRQHDLDGVIRRHTLRIGMAFVADFIFLGVEKSGSYALTEDKTRMFEAVIKGYLTSDCEVINKYGIPALMRLNAVDKEFWPTLTYGEISESTLALLADSVTKLVNGQIIQPDDKLEAHMRDIGSLPVKDSSTTRQVMNNVNPANQGGTKNETNGRKPTV